jgi:undecaprenyl diphosphate synthase
MAVGPRPGACRVRRAVRAAGDLGIEVMTIYSFSTENWSRPRAEVTFLLDLLRRFIRQDVAELHKSNVRIKIIGERDNLDASMIKLLDDAETLTAGNTRLTLVVAFNYGSQQEIARVARGLAAEIQAGKLPLEALTVDAISARLDTAEFPAPDLLIRTGGEERISNFLLWQCAYAEFVFVPEFWPDFSADILSRALCEYASRERRFGGLKVQSA